MNLFIYDKRLHIHVPHLQKPFEEYTQKEQDEILLHWESIRGNIPDKIKELESKIQLKQQRLYEEENFQTSCQLNEEIAELASIINDLWIWYRMP